MNSRPILPMFFAVAMAAALGLGVAVVRAEENTQTVRVQGIAPIIGGNELQARDKARQDAFRQAVEQVAGVIVSSETLVENFQLVNDRVYSRASGFVQGFTPLSEGPVGDGTYKAELEVTVAKKVLAESLKDIVGTTMQTVNKPRTLFMIAEQSIGDQFFIAWWTLFGGAGVDHVGQSMSFNTAENTLLEEFTNNGFPVVDLAAASKSITVSDAYKMVDLTDDQIRKLGNQAAAEIVVYGKATVKKGKEVVPGGNMYSLPANMSVRVVSTDTGRVLTSASESCPFVHSDFDVGAQEALRRCAKAVAEKIMPKVIDTLAHNQNVELRIQYDQYKNLERFRQAVRNLPSVTNVFQRAASQGSTTLELETKGATAQSVAAEIGAARLDGIKAEVTEVTQNTVTVELTGR